MVKRRIIKEKGIFAPKYQAGLVLQSEYRPDAVTELGAETGSPPSTQEVSESCRKVRKNTKGVLKMVDESRAVFYSEMCMRKIESFKNDYIDTKQLNNPAC
ncbi:MAG: hypothetical protein GY861_09970 [bacterium]|nr:hypothetical protein [bacterium]